MEQKIDQSYFDSAEDSEEDVITNYIPEEGEEESKSGGRDELFLSKQPGSNEVVRNETSSPTEIPTILLTATSAKSPKILENNICYLQKIQHEVHRLREQILHPVAQANNLRTMPIRRLSHSCPSLIDEEEELPNEASRNTKSELARQDGGKDACKRTTEESSNNMILVGMAPSEAAVNYCNMTVVTNQRLLGVSNIQAEASTTSTTADGVKIHINDLTPLGSQECLATRSSIHIAKETDDYSSSGSNLLSNRQHWMLQNQGLDLETSSGIAFSRRRRSWSSTDQDEEIAKIKKSLAKTQRSMSLSSLDSETEDTYFDASEGTTDEVDMTITTEADSSLWNNDNHREKTRSLSGNSSPLQHAAMGGTDCTSYHSLNEYPIQHKNPVKVPAFCDDGNFKCSSRHSLSAPRTTLQKSVSTPSIVAQKEAQEMASSMAIDHHNFLKTAHLESSQDPSLSKRKKRGSIFSRKKRVGPSYIFCQFSRLPAPELL